MAKNPGHFLVRSHHVSLCSLAKGIAGIAFLFGAAFCSAGAWLISVIHSPARGTSPQIRVCWDGGPERTKREIPVLYSSIKLLTTKSQSQYSARTSDLGYKNPVFNLKTAKIGAFDHLVLNPNDSEASPDYTLARYSIQ